MHESGGALSAMDVGAHSLFYAHSESAESVNKTGLITSLRSYRLVWRFVLIIAILQTLYAIGFIARTSFVVEGQRYFCLFDDAMISMQYAANWAQGHGFVWNAGERVEGYTNFAWTAIMGLCHLLGLSPSNTCLVVQLLGIPILWACLVGTVLLARSCRLFPVAACCAAALMGTSYTLIFFTLFGMETGLLTALVTFALAESVKAIRKRKGRLLPFLWFAPAVLVRIDILPIILFAFVFLYISVRKERWRLIAGLLVVVLVLSAHFLWRHHFYGQWLPNTYYLKATGWPLVDRIIPGLKHTAWTAATFGFPFLLAIVVLLFDTKRWHFLLFGSFAILVAYQLYIGGDAWPLNRFVLPASAGILVLAAEGIHCIIRLFINCKKSSSIMAYCIVLTGLCVIAINAIHWDHWLFLARPQTTGVNRINIRYLLAVERVAEPDASVAVISAGSLPYFSQRLCVDLLGKCDPYIARLPANTTIPWAGHNKSDLKYSVTKYKPDIIMSMFKTNVIVFFQEYKPVVVEVDGVEVTFCVRRNSSKIKGCKTIDWQAFKRIFMKTWRERNTNF